MVRSPPLLALAFCAAIIFGQLLEVAQSQSQNKTQPRTDPAEGVPLSLPLSFGKLNYSAVFCLYNYDFLFYNVIMEESKI